MTATEAKAVEDAVQKALETAFKPVLEWAMHADLTLYSNLRHAVSDIGRVVRTSLKSVIDSEKQV